MKRTKLRLVGIVVAIVISAVALASWFVLRQRSKFQFAEVIPSAVLRANQPQVGNLADLAKQYKLATVINLRGHSDGEGWHVAEVDACRKLGIQHVDLHLKNDDWVPQKDARRFVELLEKSAKPMLVHCKNGVDRSGWAGAVASLLAGSPLEQGLAELSPAKGHVCIQSTCYLHRFFAMYRDFLAQHNLTHSAGFFRTWILETYCPDPYDAVITFANPITELRLRPSESVELEVHVHNRSQKSWQLSSGDSGVRLGARLLGPFQDIPADPLALFRTPNNPARDIVRAGVEDGVIKGGEKRTFDIGFLAPVELGRYLLQVDMVNEHIHWFSDLGGPGVIIVLDVVAE